MILYTNNLKKTINLMDQFEALDENLLKKYKFLEIKNAFEIISPEYGKFGVDMFIQRDDKDYCAYEIDTSNTYDFDHYSTDISITMTEFIQYMYNGVFYLGTHHNSVCNIILNEIKSTIEYRLSWNDDLLDEDIIEVNLLSPIKFRAQNSSNRSGYGSVYHNGLLSYQGTLYGETNDYIIANIRLVIS